MQNTEQLSSQSLPKHFKAEILTGSKVRLEPLNIERDSQVLYERTHGSPFSLSNRSIDTYDCNELVWKYLLKGPFAALDEFISYLTTNSEKNGYAYFTVFDINTDSQIGFIAILNNFPEHLRAEIGSVVFCPLAQRTGANTETNYLLLSHLFSIGYRRIEWKCNDLNERSKKAALSLGFKFEMVQESHMIVKEQSRNTAWFRMIASEWPEAKCMLEKKLLVY